METVAAFNSIQQKHTLHTQLFELFFMLVQLYLEQQALVISKLMSIKTIFSIWP